MSGLAQRILHGDIRAASRLIRNIEDGDPSAAEELRTLFPKTGHAYVVGVTGPAGAGKSTLVDRLIAHYRAQGSSVGVLAVDPTSPFTGGALLGDRIRMQAHAQDAGVFIRSLATRGSLGGLSRATADCIRVLDAMQRDVILVETVGVGQDEVEVARVADTTLVVLVPGMGDDVQASKAGLLEVADIFVVNKSDLPGADRVVRELEQMLELRHASRAGAQKDAREPSDAWDPPIVQVAAALDRGLEQLVSSIAAHRHYLQQSGQGKVRARERARAHLVALLQERLVAGALSRLQRERGRLDEVAGKIASREADPYLLAEQLTGQLLRE